MASFNTNFRSNYSANTANGLNLPKGPNLSKGRNSAKAVDNKDDSYSVNKKLNYGNHRTNEAGLNALRNLAGRMFTYQFADGSTVDAKIILDGNDVIIARADGTSDRWSA